MMKELEDYDWFPAVLRRWQLDVVGAISVWTKLYAPLVPAIESLIKKSPPSMMEDLCSGSGKPAMALHRQLQQHIPLQLTDLYPLKNFTDKEGIQYKKDPVDVLRMQPQQETLYLMCNAFHHFDAQQQQQLLRQMQQAHASVIIAEILQPGLFTAIKIFFTTTILHLLTAPFIQPFSLPRLFFTYIIPVNIITVTYDGVVSVFKSKSCKYYKQMIEELNTAHYRFEVVEIKNWKGNLVYIKGQSE